MGVLTASILLFLLYLLSAAGTAVVAVFLERPLGARALLVSFVLPLLFLLPGFLRDATPIPVDHAMMIPPWSALGYRAMRNPNLNDIALQKAPWAKAVRMAWKEGSLPLRDRWNGSSMPLAANGLSAAFSPFTFLMLALPLGRAFTLAAAVKLFLALAGSYLWLRELKASENAALFGAVGFSFSFAMIHPWLFFPQSTVIGLWPWALFAIERLREEGSRRRAFWALVAIFVLWPLCGHVESAALGAIFTGLWLLGRWALGDLPDAPILFSRIGAAALLALGLSAFLLLPHVLTIVASNRVVNAAGSSWSGYLSWVPHAPAFPYGALTTLFPRTLGDAVTSPMLPQAASSFPEMTHGYFGIVGWACAALMLRPGSPRSRTEWALLLPLIAGFGAAILLWPFGELVSLVPALNMMLPLRFLTLLPAAGAAIAAFELDRLQRDLATDQRAATLSLVSTALLALLAVAVFLRFLEPHTAAGGMASQKRALLLALASLAALGTVTLAALLGKKPWRSALVPLAGGVLTLELFLQGGRLFEFGPPAFLFPDTPLIEFLRRQAPPFRVVGVGASLFPGSNVFAGVEDIRTHDGVERRDYVEFLDACCGYPPAEYFKFIQDTNAAGLDFLNVRYLVSSPGVPPPGPKWKAVYSGGDGTVFENRNVLPRVFTPKRTEVISNRRTPFLESARTAYGMPLRRIVAGRSWKESALILTDGSQEFRPQSENDRLEVGDWRESTNAVSFRARVSGSAPATAVASFVQDGGWTARDETGRRIPTARANGPFTALLLPPGEHMVRLTYSSPGFRTGAGISLGTLSIVALSLAAFGRRRAAP